MIEAEIFTDSEKRDALNRALTSRTFARSEQLRSFLRYVCEAELRGAKEHLNEYTIGVEVLHRPANYSPAEDSSVRTRAYELRQKLDKLYSSELTTELVRIVVPKGSYSPHFIRVLHEPKIAAHESPLAPPRRAAIPAEIESALRRPVVILLLVAMIAGLTGAALAVAFTKEGTEALDPVVLEAWKPFARGNDGALLIAATPLYLVLGPETHGAFATQTYPAPPEAYPLFRQHRPLAPGSHLGMIFTNDALGVGSMNAVVIASNTVRGMGVAPQILPERPDMMSVLHGRNVVLFGAPVDSQVISEILEKTPLSVVYDEPLREFVIRNRSNGKSFAPEKKLNGDFQSVYGLVTVLNTRESDHGRLGMIIFSGITSVGTHGAAEYFSSPRDLKALRAIFAQEGIDGFPAAYQVVVKCRFENMLLVNAEYQSHCTIRKE